MPSKRDEFREWLLSIGIEVNTEAIAEQAAATFAGAGWQPIETAPKDGTRVLLWGKDKHNEYREPPFVGSWSGDLPDDEARHKYWRVLSPGVVASIEPTHWQPLPAPPAATAEGPIVEGPVELSKRLLSEPRPVIHGRPALIDGISRGWFIRTADGGEQAWLDREGNWAFPGAAQEFFPTESAAREFARNASEGK